MTRNEILQMPAGREMDLLVAIRLMGEDASLLKVNREDSYFENHLPRYSTDIAAAWEVVEKMQSFDLEMEYPGEWRASAMLAGSDWGQTISDQTAPLAICRAALLAVMEAEPSPEREETHTET